MLRATGAHQGVEPDGRYLDTGARDVMGSRRRSRDRVDRPSPLITDVGCRIERHPHLRRYRCDD